MTKILVLGCKGMLGHRLFETCSKEFDTYGTIRGKIDELYPFEGLFHKKQNIIEHVDAKIFIGVEKAIINIKPDIIINCIGIVKSLSNKRENKLDSIWVNSLFPHQLYQLSGEMGIKLIHISTDCVFRGKFGNYKEMHNPDATDLYGRTKYLGELNGYALTIRTSIIGRELDTSRNLVEWFLSHRGGTVQGYTNAWWNGFTTHELSNIIVDIIKNHSDLTGLYHIASEPVTKFYLLKLIRELMELDIDIIPYDEFTANMTLDSSLFREKTGFISKPIRKQIEEFSEEAKLYDKWR